MTSNVHEQKERREDTYHSRAQADADAEKGGRFKKQITTQVVASEAVPIYPKLSAGPWREDVVGREPSLGFSVQEQPVIGGPVEGVPAPPANEALSRQLFVRRV